MRHALHVPPFAYDPDGPGPLQPGLPGIFAEEAPLPSEVVLDGGVLARRQREALAALQGLLLDRPPDVPPEEWRVVVATLASPVAHLGRVPGSPAKTLAAVQIARECFPGLSSTAALRRFREVQDRPAVRGLLADIRALELIDVVEQRAMVREALHATIRRGGGALHTIDPEAAPNEWSKVSACVTAACKVLTDMDRLALQAEEVAARSGGAQDNEGEDVSVGEAVAAKLRPVLADVRLRRREQVGG